MTAFWDVVWSLAGTIALLVLALPFSFLWMWAWNTSVVELFNWPTITFWQMYALAILVGVMPSRFTITRHDS
jgi:hypothetical protein